ncbi:MAG: hypothetical protein U0401_14680 [Anaerolineae bacterium]
MPVWEEPPANEPAFFLLTGKVAQHPVPPLQQQAAARARPHQPLWLNPQPAAAGRGRWRRNLGRERRGRIKTVVHVTEKSGRPAC